MASTSSFSVLAAAMSSPSPSLSTWVAQVNGGGGGVLSTTTTAAVSLEDNDSLEAAGNVTSKKPDAAEFFYQVEQLTFLWILFTMIVIGNATVLVALMLSKGRKSRMNFFIKNLAAADLCVGLISVLTDIIWKITISWEAGLVACKLIRFLQGVVTYGSTYVLVALSIDRYDAITHPMNFSGSWRRARGLVAAAWILSFIFSAPLLYFYNIKETKEYGTQCWINLTEQWQWQVYMTVVSLTIFVIPAILIAGCYIVIVFTIWNKGREMSVSTGTDGAGTSLLPNGRSKQGDRTVTTAGGQVINLKAKVSRANGNQSQTNGSRPAGHQRDGHEEVESRRASSRGLIPKAKVKTVKMTFVIIFVFILCWSPYIGFDLLQVYNCIPKNKTTRAIATFIQSLAPLNSAANPLIYCLFSTNIGQQLCNLFGCRKKPANLSTGMTTSTHSTRPATSTLSCNSYGAKRTVSASISDASCTGASRSVRYLDSSERKLLATSGLERDDAINCNTTLKSRD